MTEHEPRTLSLREHTFRFKPAMNAKDFGLVTTIGTGSAEGNLFDLLSGVVRRTMIADDRERWDALWDDDLDEPISFQEFSEFVNTLIEDESKRPTASPSPSGPTASSTRTPSTGGSGSKEAAESRPSSRVPV